MKLSVNRILYHFYGRVQPNYKYNEFQVSFMHSFSLSLDFGFSFKRSFGTLNILNISLFDLFTLRAYHSVEEDHAGFYLNMNILGLDIDYSYKDIRHYDHDNDKWEECDIAEINLKYENNKGKT